MAPAGGPTPASAETASGRRLSAGALRDLAQESRAHGPASASGVPSCRPLNVTAGPPAPSYERRPRRPYASSSRASLSSETGSELPPLSFASESSRRTSLSFSDAAPDSDPRAAAAAHYPPAPPSAPLRPGFQGTLSLPFSPLPGEGRISALQAVRVRRRGSGQPEIDAVGDVWITARRLMMTSPPASNAEALRNAKVIVTIEIGDVCEESLAPASKGSGRLSIRFAARKGSTPAGSFMIEQLERGDPKRAASVAKFFAALLHSLFLRRFEPGYALNHKGRVVLRQVFVKGGA
eukprot:tig00021073_g18053.t1